MAYGIFYSQCEITKKNGRLASIDDAIRIAKDEFFSDGRVDLKSTYDTIEDAKAALDRLHCELCRAQFLASVYWYNAYMCAIVELTERDGGELMPGDIVEFASWICPDDEE
jgi:hypothetical protein